MHSAEILSQLRALHWLGTEAKRLPPHSPERTLLDSQINALRARLPVVILHYHDHRAQQGLPAIANLEGAACGHCGEPLPLETVRELSVPGRFDVCPKCGIFLWSGDESCIPASNTPMPVSPDPSAKPSKKGARRE